MGGIHANTCHTHGGVSVPEALSEILGEGECGDRGRLFMPGEDVSYPLGEGMSYPPGEGMSYPLGEDTSHPLGEGASCPPGEGTSYPPGESVLHPPSKGMSYVQGQSVSYTLGEGKSTLGKGRGRAMLPPIPAKSSCDMLASVLSVDGWGDSWEDWLGGSRRGRSDE